MISSVSGKNLACVRGVRRLFDGVGFQVRAGSALAVEGANGAGKTSLLRMIAGFLAPAGGTLTLTRESIDITDAEERGRFVGWLGHQDGLKPQFTVIEHLRFYAALYDPLHQQPGRLPVRTLPLLTGAAGMSPSDAPHEGDVQFRTVLDQVGLTRQRDLPCRYLSAGQKRRLALARLVVMGRPVWLLDEPFAALDTAGQALVAQLMADHCAGGGIVIAATHDPLGVGHESLKL
jgi:heme exporter protein A